MRKKARASSLLHLEVGDVKCSLALALDLGVVQHGVVRQDDLGHTVGKVAVIIQAQVAFKNRGFAVLFQDNKIPWLRHRRAVLSDGEKNQMNRLLDNRSLRN